MSKTPPVTPSQKETQKTTPVDTQTSDSQQDEILKKISLSNDSKSAEDSKSNFQQEKTKKWLKVLGIVFGVLFLVLAGIGFYSYQVFTHLQAQAQTAKITAQTTYDSFKAQDLLSTQAHLKELITQEEEIHQTYQKLSFYQYLPFLRAYYLDGEHAFAAAKAGLSAGEKTIAAITPYADVLGFTGEGSFTGGTAEDRLKLILETIDKVSPILDEISTKLATVQNELAAINPNRYPESLMGYEVRPMLFTAQDSAQVAINSLTQYRPIIEKLPAIMGADGERKKYLILFQNDNELRPTGGFLTAYATIFIEDGKVTPEKSDDIYELDKKFSERIPIPEELGRYLTTEKYWNLRDMNTSPDFKISMDQFLEHYLQLRGEPDDIDGVIAVDTEFLTKLLAVLGPIEVPGYGTFTAENSPKCDCPQVVYALSEIITRPTPYLRDDRKGILGPMMRSILTKSYGAPKQQWPQLFEIGLESLGGRDIQLFFFDSELQAAAEAINAAGRMTPPEENTDFLGIVNANLGGAKSNLFTEYKVTQVVTSPPENGQLTKKVEITYKNTRKADNCNLEAGLLCLNSTLRDWTRIYLPAGSKLISAQGFNEEAREYEENGFHVIDGFFILEPLGQAKLKLEYTVPYTESETYRVELWKQGGVDPIPTLIDITGGQEQIEFGQDTLYETPF